MAMPDQEERETLEKASEDLREGKAPSTAAGEFVREEIDHVREGRHGARSPQQAVAIGLSKARRAGIPLKPPAKGKASTKESAERDYERGQSHARKKTSAKRSRATSAALKKAAGTSWELVAGSRELGAGREIDFGGGWSILTTPEATTCGAVTTGWWGISP
jgi:hypothetical protein